ncbi:MAG: hypothetical protein MR639_06415 [Clostridium sp.]|uniref:hypothetical protein n=1 Tax=Clostridium sp. TaxID=1506 RepID=UPI002A8B65D1|nr:hypothetical protein [Clostridium sp.]MDY5099419.1 hypothetical protein [Clostridium sp.]
MNNSNKSFKFILLILTILPLILPILNIYLGIVITANVLPQEVVYYGNTSLLTLSLKIFLFSLAVDAILSLIGFNSDRRINLMIEKKFTSIAFETAISVFTLIVGYSLIKSFGLTDFVFFRDGLALFMAISVFLDLITLFFIGMFIHKNGGAENKDESNEN